MRYRVDHDSGDEDGYREKLDRDRVRRYFVNNMLVDPTDMLVLRAGDVLTYEEV